MGPVAEIVGYPETPNSEPPKRLAARAALAALLHRVAIAPRWRFRSNWPHWGGLPPPGTL
eukprot:2537421-Alexandrium_andersonii.AAC.1